MLQPGPAWPSMPGTLLTYAAINLTHLRGPRWGFGGRPDHPREGLHGLSVLPPLASLADLSASRSPDALFFPALVLRLPLVGHTDGAPYGRVTSEGP